MAARFRGEPVSDLRDPVQLLVPEASLPEMRTSRMRLVLTAPDHHSKAVHCPSARSE